MKKRDYIITTILGNGKHLKPVIRKTEKGISDYANRMYRKYGDEVTVEVGHFLGVEDGVEGLQWVLDFTYHA